MSGCGSGPQGPWVDSAILNFFRPSGLNPSIAGAYLASGGGECVALAQQIILKTPIDENHFAPLAMICGVIA